MTDLSNLRTASLYINNQLLSRGLLRDGRAIDFADPAGASKGDGKDNSDNDNTANTMARVISIVNDLILRRDRDAEHRESLSTALRTVRAESLRQANDLHRTIERHANVQRRADLGEAAEASLRAQLAAADATNHKLRDEAARMRQLVAQTRTSCANEVRKRDRQIDGLKKAVTDAGRARGERRSPAITTITITGGESAQQQQSRSAFTSPQSTPTAHRDAITATTTTTTTTAATTSSDYDLRSETNAFLADLARSLSDDNETLLGIVHHTSRHLKAMSGYVAAEEMEAAKETADKQPGEHTDNEATTPAVADCGALAVEMEAVLEHLRTILTNPSFVPIEEVVLRESEIGRLRDGWEKMEGRWKEAVHLLDGWRRRMAVSGRAVNMEEIKMGLRLSPVRVRNVVETSLGLNLRLPPLHEGEDEDEGEEDADRADGYGNEAEEEEDDDDDVDEEGGRDWPPLGRTPSPADTLHLVPAPGAADYAHDHVHDGLSDSESDASSMFGGDDDSDYDDEPNVQIIEQSVVIPSLEASPEPEPPHAAFSRSTPSPSPPPPEKPAMSTVTAAAIKEKKKVEEKEPQRAVATKPAQQGLQPSQTAGNRGGVSAAALGGKTAPSSDTKKDTATTTATAATTTVVTRGRRRPGEVTAATAATEEAAKYRKQARVVAADKPTAKPAAPRTAATGNTTGISRANSARNAGQRPIPGKQARAAPSRAATTTAASALAQEKHRPASAASQASSEASAASAATAASTASSSASDDSVSLVPSAGTSAAASRPLSSLASRKAATAATTTGSRPRLDRPNRHANDDKVVAPPPQTTSSSSEQMPPPPIPASMAAASRARSRSPLKITAAATTAMATAATTTAASGVTSRLPLPRTTGNSATTATTTATASSTNPPPASPALNMATIAAKLAASEREADAARVRAKLKAARDGFLGGGAGAKSKAQPVAVVISPTADAAPLATNEAESRVDPVKKTVVAADVGSEALATSANSNNANDQQQQQQHQQPLRKKRDPKDQRRASKTASRRRSTLNPWELKSLMAGSVEGDGAAVETAAP